MLCSCMPPRLTRYVVVAAALSIGAILTFFRSSSPADRWRDLPLIHQYDHYLSSLAQELQWKLLQDQRPFALHPAALETSSERARKQDFSLGRAVPGRDYNYTRTVVIGRRKSEDVSWLAEQLPHLQRAVYVVDDPHAPLHPPQNKGNEVMVYLSYIIDHYASLPDVSIFMHAHRYAWHNNHLFGADAALMLKHLRSERVVREGYVNLRCQWYPGCPAWLHPDASQKHEEKEEEQLIAQAWGELFPGEPLPSVLAQPCCSQFALSRERITSLPLREYERLRVWMLRTELEDALSGRVWEYLWQYLFTGETVYCPTIHACYCDGFGACFEDEDAFQDWFKTRFEVRRDEVELLGWLESEARYKMLVKERRGREAKSVERAPEGRIVELRIAIAQSWLLLDEKRERAFERGRDSALRARIAGRMDDGT